MWWRPEAAVRGAENQGKEMCDSTQSLHIYNQVLQDLFQVSEEHSSSSSTCFKNRIQIMSDK